MAVGPQGVAVFVGTRKTDVYTVIDRDKDRVADDVQPFAPPIDFKVPNGVCFSKDGFLFVVEANRILTFPAAEFFHENPDVAVGSRRRARQADPARRGVLQPRRPGVPDRAGQQALRRARSALQRAAEGEARAVQRVRHRRHHPHGPRRQQPRGLRERHPQLGRHGLQPGQRRALVHRQSGRRHGRRHPARRAQPDHRPGSELRLPVVRRRHGAHRRVQGRGVAGGRRQPGDRGGAARGRSRA